MFYMLLMVPLSVQKQQQSFVPLAVFPPPLPIYHLALLSYYVL